MNKEGESPVVDLDQREWGETVSLMKQKVDIDQPDFIINSVS